MAWDDVPGVISRHDGKLRNAGKRPLPPLDDLPFPVRDAEARHVLGIPCAPLLGSRGCYADCAFCCIYAYADSAEGARYHRRSPENIVGEMEREYSARGVRLFVFHDDNFFVPSPARNIERYTRLQDLLLARGMDDIALVIKCRPNDVHEELFALLKSMGMIRAYVGIETNSDEGVVGLNRRISPADNQRAVALLKRLDIYCSFNVLIFDPEATVEGAERNLGFMERHVDIPFNFCRAEVYAGTPLESILREQGRLRGNYLGWGYSMRSPRVELLFRIAATAFHGRNFKSDGVANLNMGLRFDNEVLRRFYPDAWDDQWHRRLVEFSRRVGNSSVTMMRDAHAFAGTVDLSRHGEIKRYAIELARRVGRSNLDLLREVKVLRLEMEDRMARLGHRWPAGPPGSPAPWAAETARLTTSVGSTASTEQLPAPPGAQP